ncbi:gamma-glutamylcyclotransferase [Pendulispora brunnea]|uniref:Gamma-glutamylcyclotransferase n=1 Tax=Pendulispora brunnea TaxID=2905690 RepID=A0ABZ2KNJ0_9BACT
MKRQDGSTWYFAYGANMSRRVFVERRGMRPLESEIASLQGYRLAFALKGFAVVEPAFATLLPDASGTVHGVLHRLGEADLERLEKLEDEYERCELPVTGARCGPTVAQVYLASSTTLGLRPSRRYLALLCEGAREAGLPEAYVAWLAAHPSAHVPVLSTLAGASAKLYETYLAVSKRGARRRA